MKKIILVLWAFLFFACSEEEQVKEQPLPALPKIQAPASLQGLYLGRIPCDECGEAAAVQLKLELDSLGTAVISETDYESGQTTLNKGVYTDSAGFLTVRFAESSRRLYFKRHDDFSFHLADYTGKEYADESGAFFLLNRIIKPAQN
ncbi:MAG: hypothetical protein LBR60_04590 [Fibrobacter sp.]|jgi:hypothetical protein|nr:hypothetical protein [Fibrobacter sp.]